MTPGLAAARFLPVENVQLGERVWALGYCGDLSAGCEESDPSGNRAIERLGDVEGLNSYDPQRNAFYLNAKVDLLRGFSGGPLVLADPQEATRLGCAIGVNESYIGEDTAHSFNDFLAFDAHLHQLIDTLLDELGAAPLGAADLCG